MKFYTLPKATNHIVFLYSTSPVIKCIDIFGWLWEEHVQYSYEIYQYTLTRLEGGSTLHITSNIGSVFPLTKSQIQYYRSSKQYKLRSSI